MGTKASRVRKKLAAGETVTSEESSLLAAWDKLKAATGRPTEEAPKPEAKAKAKAPEAPKPEAKAPDAKPDIKAPPDAPPSLRPPPDAPPRILGAGLGSKDWRQRWRVGASDREATCVQAANAWRSLMIACIVKIEEYEQKPIINREMLNTMIYPSIVLSVDALLPEAFEVRPEMVAAFGTSVMLGQRVIVGRSPRAKEIEDVKARKEGLRSVPSAKVVELDAQRRPPDVAKPETAKPDTAPSIEVKAARSEAKTDEDLLI